MGAYPYVHLVRGALLGELGEHGAAARALDEAAKRARNGHERRQIEERMDELASAARRS